MKPELIEILRMRWQPLLSPQGATMPAFTKPIRKISIFWALL
ncbi:Uncharacterised protein [Salmonella enterica subsp. enterica serovar Madelia]|nr:Uncharacterised protein [Salmonella enterica subsp. enterica serovar Madelia]